MPQASTAHRCPRTVTHFLPSFPQGSSGPSLTQFSSDASNQLSPAPEQAELAPRASLTFIERHLDTVTERIQKLCLRHRLYSEEAEDFRSYALVRLLKRSQRLEELFEGRSNLATYLDSILGNALRDYRIERWGKWRASARAEQLGAKVMKLEELVYRDRMKPADAIRSLVQSSTPTSQRDQAEEQLWVALAELPIRVDRRPVEVPEDHDARFSDAHEVLPPDLLAAITELDQLRSTLLDALAQLSGKQRQVLCLRYSKGLSFAEIGRATGMRTDSLYRLVARALSKLRNIVRANGLEANSVLDAHATGAGDFCVERLFADAR